MSVKTVVCRDSKVSVALGAGATVTSPVSRSTSVTATTAESVVIPSRTIRSMIETFVLRPRSVGSEIVVAPAAASRVSRVTTPPRRSRLPSVAVAGATRIT